MKRYDLRNINSIVNSPDLFICSSGFEERAIKIIENLQLSPSMFVAIFSISDFYNANKKCAEDMKKLCINTQATIIEVAYSKPEQTFQIIREYIEAEFKKSHKHILIDVTSFTHEHLLMLLGILNYYKNHEMKIDFCYTLAEDYAIDSKDSPSKWLTKGISDIRTVIGYPGYFDAKKKNHLIIILGFEVERAIKIMEQFEYDKVTLCIGKRGGSINDNLFEINLQCFQTINRNYQEIEMYDISLVDIKQSVNEINSLISYNSLYNNVIIPMNNKISTISSGIVAINNKNLQLSYVVADEYNITNYSTPSNDLFFYEDIL